MSIYYIFLLMTIFASSVTAGTCPKYPILWDFDFHSYTGLWYQQDKLQSGWEAPGRCWKILYIRDPKTGQYKMKMIFQNTITGRMEEYDSQITLLGPNKPSIIKYTIPFTFIEDRFQVLATDYDSFSVEYKCNPNGILEKRESIYLLTREKNPSPLVLQKAYAIMHRYGIDLRKLERVDQSCGGIQLVDDEYPLYDYYDAEPQQVLDGQNNPGEDGSESRYSPQYFEYEEEPPLPPPPQPSVRKSDKNRGFRRKHPDRRLTLGQSLATRLWHVLHTPV